MMIGHKINKMIIKSGYIYLISLKTNDDGGEIYKLGKTKKDPYARFSQYKGHNNSAPSIIVVGYVNDCDRAENDLIEKFNCYFKCAFGKEYFVGDVQFMMYLFYDYLSRTSNIDFFFNKTRHNENNDDKRFVCYNETTVKSISMLSYKEIYEIMKTENKVFYDNPNSTEKIKLFIEMKIPVGESNSKKNLDENIENVLTAINAMISEKFNIINPEIIILMNENNKRENNICNILVIYKNIIMPTKKHLINFMNYFINPIINMNVYRKKHIEIPNIFGNTKNNFIYYKSYNYEVPKNEYEFFLDVCVFNTDKNISQEYLGDSEPKNKNHEVICDNKFITNKNKTELLAEILNNINEDKYDLSFLIKKKRMNKEEGYALQKILFNKLLGIGVVTGKKNFKKLFIKYYGKQIILKNFEIFFGFDWESDFKQTEIDAWCNTQDIERKEIIVSLLNFILNENKKDYTYDDLKDKKHIGYLQLMEAIKRIKTESSYYKNEKETGDIFNINKTTLLSKQIGKKNKKEYEIFKINSDSNSSEQDLDTSPKKETDFIDFDPKINNVFTDEIYGKENESESDTEEKNKKPRTVKKKTDNNDSDDDSESDTEEKNKKPKTVKKKTDNNESDDDSESDTEEKPKKSYKGPSKETVEKTTLIKFIIAKLKLYGIVFHRIEDKVSVRIENGDGSPDSIRGRDYSLSLDEEIANIIKSKHENKKVNIEYKFAD